MKYQILYIDPPWTYQDKALAGNRGAGCKYPLLTVEDLVSLPVNKIADDDSILFIWVTMPQLNVVFDVIKAWGFLYKTCAFTWVKRNKVASSWFMGMGRWTRSNPELCLLATKGHPRRVDAGISSVVDTPIEEHSKKPSVVREKIVQLCGDLPRIELFARERVPGWVSLGFDIDGLDIRESLRQVADGTYIGNVDRLDLLR